MVTSLKQMKKQKHSMSLHIIYLFIFAMSLPIDKLSYDTRYGSGLTTMGVLAVESQQICESAVFGFKKMKKGTLFKESRNAILGLCLVVGAISSSSLDLRQSTQRTFDQCSSSHISLLFSLRTPVDYGAPHILMQLCPLLLLVFIRAVSNSFESGTLRFSLTKHILGSDCLPR